MTRILHSFSFIISTLAPPSFTADSSLDASILDEDTLHPTIALRFAATGDSGELLYDDPPDESPLDKRSILRAFEEYDFCSGIAFATFGDEKITDDADTDDIVATAMVLDRKDVKTLRLSCNNVDGWLTLIDVLL
eukprot:CAMPEP_0203639598 /NCGR_PEP_ID=MMETSP0088-20131115/5323_1 /ASSEMBLY_ACC=CAM_ASM_001087 /TAXON_ID=426623 /ORGANISM="Chaetoceros affinis, Strain CCMP159" /LENGTH=134 /DNA_ID=CAMNT_0050494539 /DNA_START=806 /DNA_END=1210 /DNA_ORIENTATION=-